MSTLRVNAIQNTSGVSQYLAQAWVNFDGTGTVSTNQTVRGSGNVSSVFKNATGDYTINFTNALADANFSAVGNASDDSTNMSLPLFQVYSRSTGSVRVRSNGGTTYNPIDRNVITVAIFR